MGVRQPGRSLQLRNDSSGLAQNTRIKTDVLYNNKMDLARAIKHVGEFDEKFRVITGKVNDIITMQRQIHEKMMEGFRCIEKAFMMNCKAQMTMSEQIDEANGTITDFDDVDEI